MKAFKSDKRYDRSRAGLALKPSADGLIAFGRLNRETRVTLIGESTTSEMIRIEFDGGRRETWSRHFWIPLRGNRQW